MGTDAALGLAMAQVILAESLHNVEYVREQTDLPILVREDTGRYLRESDLKRGGSDELLYFWDEAARCAGAGAGLRRATGGSSIALGALRPALAGRRSVKLADGESRSTVRPLLERLREHLDANYTPEQAAAITGVGAGTIRRVARELAAAGSAMIYSSWGACKHYHSDLIAARRDPADGAHGQPGQERRRAAGRVVVAGRGLRPALPARRDELPLAHADARGVARMISRRLRLARHGRPDAETLRARAATRR